MSTSSQNLGDSIGHARKGSESIIKAHCEKNTLTGEHCQCALYKQLLDTINLPINNIERLRRTGAMD